MNRRFNSGDQSSDKLDSIDCTGEVELALSDDRVDAFVDNDLDLNVPGPGKDNLDDSHSESDSLFEICLFERSLRTPVDRSLEVESDASAT